MVEEEYVAFGDESSDASVYAMAGIVLPRSECEAARDHFRALLIGKQQRIHWATERAARRAILCDAVADCGGLVAVAYHRPDKASRQERSRRRCLNGLLGLLGELEVVELTLEARDEEGNRRDRRNIEEARRSGIVRSPFAYRHRPPANEAALWIADVAVSAARMRLSGGEASFADRFDSALMMVDRF